jgi:methionine-rich copper-binding protein CopC
MLFGLAALSMHLFESRDAPAHDPANLRVVDALPVDGAVLVRPPERVLLRFSSGIESRSTRITLTGPLGSSSLSIEGNGGDPVQELSIPVPDQGRGRYLVRWEIVAMDGERLGGKVRFVVRN